MVIDQIDRQTEISRSSSSAKLENPISSEKSSAMSQVFFSSDRSPEIYLTVAVQDPATRE